MPKILARLFDALGNAGLAFGAGYLLSSLSATGITMPLWFPFGVVLGVLFCDPMSAVRGRWNMIRGAGRFAIGLCMAYLMFRSLMMVIDGEGGHFVLVMMLPLLVLPLFAGRAASNRETTAAPEPEADPASA